MPNYDYKCENCEQIFEYVHPMSDTKDWDACPSCELGEGYLHKVFSPTPGHFKGQGWGKTYREYKPKKES